MRRRRVVGDYDDEDEDPIGNDRRMTRLQKVNSDGRLGGPERSTIWASRFVFIEAAERRGGRQFVAEEETRSAEEEPVQTKKEIKGDHKKISIEIDRHYGMT